MYHSISGFNYGTVNYITHRDKDFNPKSTFQIGSIGLIPKRVSLSGLDPSLRVNRNVRRHPGIAGYLCSSKQRVTDGKQMI